MAQFKAVRSGPTILLLILLILALALGGFIWFDFLGFVDARQIVSPVLSLLRIRQPAAVEDPEALNLLDQERLKMQLEELALRVEDLDIREGAIRDAETQLVQLRDSLDERESALTEKEKSFNDRLNQYDNRDKNLRQASANFVGMQPALAVERLLAMGDQDLIDILRITETIAQESGRVSVVSYWLSLMPPERAADLSRKMLKKPEA